MVQQENLDVRTVTLGINLTGCSDRSLQRNLRIDPGTNRDGGAGSGDHLQNVAARVRHSIVNRRLSVTPIARVGYGHGVRRDAGNRPGRSIGRRAEVKVDLLGGFTALVHGGMTQGATDLLDALPRALSGNQASLRLGQRGDDQVGHQHGCSHDLGQNCGERSPRRPLTREASGAPSW